MIKHILIVVVLLLAFAMIILWPCLPDLGRYVCWRLTASTLFDGKVVSGDAVIHYTVSGEGIATAAWWPELES